MKDYLESGEKAAKMLRQYKLEIFCLLLIGTVIFLVVWLREEITGRREDLLLWTGKTIEVQNERNEAKDHALQLSEREVQSLQRERDRRP